MQMKPSAANNELPVISDSGNFVFSMNTQILVRYEKTMYAPIGHLT